MSRAFVIENDDWNTCWEMGRDCKYATLRRTCELEKCIYLADDEDEDEDKEQK